MSDQPTIRHATHDVRTVLRRIRAKLPITLPMDDAIPLLMRGLTVVADMEFPATFQQRRYLEECGPTYHAAEPKSRFDRPVEQPGPRLIGVHDEAMNEWQPCKSVWVDWPVAKEGDE